MQVLACLTSSAREIRTPMLVLPLVPVSRSPNGASATQNFQITIVIFRSRLHECPKSSAQTVFFTSGRQRPSVQVTGAGTWFGSRLGRKNEYQQWLRNQKRAAYSEFIGAFDVVYLETGLSEVDGTAVREVLFDLVVKQGCPYSARPKSRSQ